MHIESELAEGWLRFCSLFMRVRLSWVPQSGCREANRRSFGRPIFPIPSQLEARTYCVVQERASSVISALVHGKRIGLQRAL